MTIERFASSTISGRLASFVSGLLLLLAATWITAAPADAGAVFVETTSATSTSDCTLGDAIATVLQGQSVGACTWTTNPYVRIQKGSTYELDAPVTVTGGLSISGYASAVDPAGIVWPEGQSGRFFDVTPGAYLGLSNLKITGGSAFDGGAVRIQADARARLFGVTLSGHAAQYSGGAVDNAGTLEISASTFESNTAGHAGGVHNHGAGTLEIKNSLFHDNSSFMGGALYQHGGAIEVDSSTFSANQAVYGGGALYSKSGDSTIDFSTFRDNTASYGSAFLMEWGTLTLHRSALTASAGDPLCYGSQYVTLGGGNVLSDASCGTSPQDDVVGQEIAMSELLHHGGLTRVHVPLCDWSSGECESPLRDRDDLNLCDPEEYGDPASIQYRDQRDQFNRLSPDPSPTVISGGTACDVGAYEAVCQGGVAEGETVTVLLHEYQVLDGDPVLLDNGDCFGHPLWDEQSTSGCSIHWMVQGRLQVEDIVFLEPGCPFDCFSDTTACEQQCTGVGGRSADNYRPAGWTEVDNGSYYSVEAPGCEIPELEDGESLRYLICLRHQLTGESHGCWDPQTPVLNDEAPDSGSGSGG